MQRNSAKLSLALCVLCTISSLAAEKAVAGEWDINVSLTDRAKWKTFGVNDWTSYDHLERALPGRSPVTLEKWSIPNSNEPVTQLKSLIAYAEAGAKGYNAVHVSGRIKPPKQPTLMTLDEIQIWVRDSPGQPHAIGRYQFIPSTLKMLKRRARLSGSTRFTPAVQDQLADILLADAGMVDFLNRKITQERFMNNLALIWAGLPTSDGRSAYHGYASNRATITLKFYRSQMERIFE